MQSRLKQLQTLAEKKYQCALCKGKPWYLRDTKQGIIPECFIGNPKHCKILIIGANPALRKNTKRPPLNNFNDYWHRCVNLWETIDKEGRSVQKDNYFGRLFNIVKAIPSIKWNRNVVHCDIVSCYTKSKRDLGKSKEFKAIAQTCSKDIKKFIKLLQPKVILTNDVSASEVLIDILGLDSSGETVLTVNDKCRLVPAGVTHSGRMDRFSFQRLKNDFKKAYES